MNFNIVDVIIGNLVNWLNETMVFGLQQAVDICGSGIVNYTIGNNNAGFDNAFTTLLNSTNSSGGVLETISTFFSALGFGLCILLIIFGLFRNMFSGLGFAGEAPFKMVLRLVISFFLVGNFSDFAKYVIQIFYQPIALALNALPVEGVSFSSGLASSSITGLIATIMVVIFGILIMINLFKLGVEIIERYLLCNVLLLASPALASTVTLESTSKIFANTIKMIIGQVVLLIMNIITIKFIIVSFNPLITDLGNNLDLVKIFVDMVFILALIKIAQKFDNYIRDLGMLAGVTGGDLMGDIIGATHMLSKGFDNAKSIGGFVAKGGKALSNAMKFGSSGSVLNAASNLFGDNSGIGGATAAALGGLTNGKFKNMSLATDENGNTLIKGFDKAGNESIIGMRELSGKEAQKFKPNDNQRVVVGENGKQYLMENLTASAKSGDLNAISALNASKKAFKSNSVPIGDGKSLNEIAKSSSAVKSNFASDLARGAMVGGVALKTADAFIPKNEPIGSAKGVSALVSDISNAGFEVNDKTMKYAEALDGMNKPINDVTLANATALSDAGFEVNSENFDMLDSLQDAGFEINEDNLSMASQIRATGLEVDGDTLQAATDLSSVGIEISEDNLKGYSLLLGSGYAEWATPEALNNACELFSSNLDVNNVTMTIADELCASNIPITAENVATSFLDKHGIVANESNIPIANAMLNSGYSGPVSVDTLGAASSLMSIDAPINSDNIKSVLSLNRVGMSINNDTLKYANAFSKNGMDSHTVDMVSMSICEDYGIDTTRQNINNMTKCGGNIGEYLAKSFNLPSENSEIFSQAVELCRENNMISPEYYASYFALRNNGVDNPTPNQVKHIGKMINLSKPIERFSINSTTLKRISNFE